MITPANLITKTKSHRRISSFGYRIGTETKIDEELD
jgi:hypothetical protein